MPAELLLPVAAERFRVFRPAHSRLHVNARCERVSAGSRRADIVFRDAAGALVAELSGVRFVPAHSASLTALASDHWLHEIVWESVAAAPAPAAPRTEGAWLLLCDRAGTGEALARALTGMGELCRSISAHDHADPDQFAAWLTDASWRDGRPLRGVVHLSTVDDAPRSAPHAPDFDGDDERGPISALHLVQAMARHAPQAQLVLITCGAVAARRRCRTAIRWQRGSGDSRMPPPLNITSWRFA